MKEFLGLLVTLLIAGLLAVAGLLAAAWVMYILGWVPFY